MGGYARSTQGRTCRDKVSVVAPHKGIDAIPLGLDAIPRRLDSKVIRT